MYVIAVLQASETSIPIDTRASTYGYFYELFIRNNLARGRNRVEYDITLAYLAHLANQMHTLGKSYITAAEFETIHEDYERRYDIQRNFVNVRDELLNQNVLTQFGERFQFKYKYIYYYFSATYIRDHLYEDEVKFEVVPVI